MNVIGVWDLLATISVLTHPDQHPQSLSKDTANELDLLALFNRIRLADTDGICP